MIYAFLNGLSILASGIAYTVFGLDTIALVTGQAVVSFVIGILAGSR